MGDYELYHAAARQHKYIKKIGNRYFYTQEEIKAYLAGKKPKIRETYDGQKEIDVGDKGVRVGNKKVSVYNYNNKKYEKDEIWSVKRHGRLKSEYNEVGSEHTLDLADKKTYKKRRAAEEKQEQALRDFQKKEWGIESYEEKKARQRKEAKKQAKKHLSKTVKSMKKQSAKGKKKISTWYRDSIAKPTVTSKGMSYDEFVKK